MSLRIGLDFDNTVIRYDAVFHRLAVRRGWLPARPPLTKEKVKDLLLAADGDDRRWQALQAEAYGREILAASFFPGCRAFLRRAAAAGHEVFIVSHKSKTSHFDRSVKLRDWALRWLKSNARGLIEPGHVFFAEDRDAKVRRIAALDLDLFVDDLLPVLDHRDFPARTAAVHFRSATWTAVTRALACVEKLGPAAFAAVAKTCLAAPVRAERAARRGNNRLWKVTLEDGRRVLVKRYLVDARDRRERGLAEFRALRLMWDNGIRCVPEPLYLEPGGAFAVMSWLDGADLRFGLAGSAEVRQAADFIRRLSGLRPSNFPEAADSRRCLADYARHIETRLDRIREGAAALKSRPEARRFVADTVLPLKEAVLARFFAECKRQGLDPEKPLPPSRRILSPSDFGFHNALREARGRMRFLDFEYFGQDDPAKLACDFCHHAGFSLSPALKRLFVERLAAGLPESDAFLRRVDLLLDVIGLEWLLIVLNVLSADTRTRRKFADPGLSEDALVLSRLKAARRIAADLKDGRRPVALRRVAMKKHDSKRAHADR
ncbi:MAG: hypothetical protein AAB320_01540 [Elusimicrobiota bacterium]